MSRALALALLVLVAAAQAGPLAGADGFRPRTATPTVALDQRLGAPLPLDARFMDSDGRALRLADLFAPGRPVLLALGYDRCPQLCGLLMQGLLESLHDAGLPPTAYRVVFASIDPSDTPADATARRRVDLDYARFLAGDVASPAPPDLTLLVGAPPAIAALTQAVGDVYQPTPGDAARFAHPAGVIVVTPEGRVSRYLMGVRFGADDLRAALVEASGGRIGSVTDRLAMLCAHLDPHLGARTPAVLGGLRVVGLAMVASLGVFVWRQRRRGKDIA